MSKQVNVSNFYGYWEELTSRYGNAFALHDEYMNEKYTYSEAFSAIKKMACGFKKLGLKKGDHVSLFSENSCRWLIVDQGLLVSGMVDAVRGSGASVSELDYILNQSDSVALIVENVSLIKALKDSVANSSLKFVMHISKEHFKGDYPCPVYSFDEVMKMGQDSEFVKDSVKKEDLATLIYTSGTTGFPKGVMLTQGNLLSQVKNIHPSLKLKKAGRALTILPIWHSYERALEYYLLSCGGTLIYTNLKNFKADMKKHQPEYFVSVPRIWESIYDGVQKSFASMPDEKQQFVNFVLNASIEYKRAKRILLNAEKSKFDMNIWQRSFSVAALAAYAPVHLFGKTLIYPKIKKGISSNFSIGISGGGAFQKHLEEFYDAVGIRVHNGYGLTESSPVIGLRQLNNPVLGSIGNPIIQTKIKLIDPESKKDITNTKRGVLCVKGPQVMRGYYKNQEATKNTISADGWLNTGDIVEIAPNGSIFITGRAKDTIVLLNGENIEPQGIEDACLQSPFIKQIVLVGQDKPSLGALVVPDYENIKASAKDGSVAQIIKEEIKTLVQQRSNFQPFERVSSVRLLDEEFSLENGLMTQTVKIKRNKVFEKYANVIEDMFS